MNEIEVTDPPEVALAEQDPVEHKLLLAYVDSLHDLPPAKQFLGGFTMGFRSIKFLWKHPNLWKNVAIPAAINFILFMVMAATLLFNVGDIVGWIWTKPDDWLVVLWWVVLIIFVPLMLLISYVSTIIFGGVVASPFNETLSGKTEKIVRGQLIATDGSLKGNAVGAARGVFTAAVTASCYAACMIPVFLISVIPVAGSVVGGILGATVSSFFLAVEYTDHPLERRLYRWRDKIKMVWDNKPLTFGFGLGTSMLLWVPFLNFLTMPIAVIGGTTVGLSLNHRKEQLASQPPALEAEPAVEESVTDALPS